MRNGRPAGHLHYEGTKRKEGRPTKANKRTKANKGRGREEFFFLLGQNTEFRTNLDGKNKKNNNKIIREEYNKWGQSGMPREAEATPKILR